MRRGMGSLLAPHHSTALSTGKDRIRQTRSTTFVRDVDTGGTVVVDSGIAGSAASRPRQRTVFVVRDGKPGPAQRVVIGTESPQRLVLR